MAGPFPENGEPDAFSQTIQATCDTNAYSGCGAMAIDPDALNFLLQMVARLANISPDNNAQLNCSTPETLLTNVKKYIDDTASAISDSIENADIPCLTTDLGGNAPTGPQPNIWYDDRAGQKVVFVWDCESGSYRGLIEFTSQRFCSLDRFNPASDTLADSSLIAVCIAGTGKMMTIAEFKNALGINDGSGGGQVGCPLAGDAIAIADTIQDQASLDVVGQDCLPNLDFGVGMNLADRYTVDNGLPKSKAREYSVYYGGSPQSTAATEYAIERLNDDVYVSIDDQNNRAMFIAVPSGSQAPANSYGKIPGVWMSRSIFSTRLVLVGNYPLGTYRYDRVYTYVSSTIERVA